MNGPTTARLAFGNLKGKDRLVAGLFRRIDALEVHLAVVTGHLGGCSDEVDRSAVAADSLRGDEADRVEGGEVSSRYEGIPWPRPQYQF